MESLVLPVLKWLYESWGPGVTVAVVSIVLSGWVAVKAKTVLDGVATAMTKVATAQEENNKIISAQQPICIRHAVSQESLIDSMRSLVNEVHIATTSVNRVQENNMKAVLELLERQMELNRK